MHLLSSAFSAPEALICSRKRSPPPCMHACIAAYSRNTRCASQLRMAGRVSSPATTVPWVEDYQSSSECESLDPVDGLVTGAPSQTQIEQLLAAPLAAPAKPLADRTERRGRASREDYWRLRKAEKTAMRADEGASKSAKRPLDHSMASDSDDDSDADGGKPVGGGAARRNRSAVVVSDEDSDSAGKATATPAADGDSNSELEDSAPSQVSCQPARVRRCSRMHAPMHDRATTACSSARAPALPRSRRSAALSLARRLPMQVPPLLLNPKIILTSTLRAKIWVTMRPEVRSKVSPK